MAYGERTAGGEPERRPRPDRKAPVLVVDDEADLREVLRAVLEEEGYGVTTAATGSEALVLLRARQTPCIVLLDHHLAGMSGQSVLRALRSDPACPRHAVLYMSAGGASESLDVQDELAALHVPYLRKPFELDELLALVAEASTRVADAGNTAGRDADSQACAAPAGVGLRGHVA